MLIRAEIKDNEGSIMSRGDVRERMKREEVSLHSCHPSIEDEKGWLPLAVKIKYEYGCIASHSIECSALRPSLLSAWPQPLSDLTNIDPLMIFLLSFSLHWICSTYCLFTGQYCTVPLSSCCGPLVAPLPLLTLPGGPNVPTVLYKKPHLPLFAPKKQHRKT